MTTPYGAPEWAASQAAPDVTVNEALRRTQSGAGMFPVVDKDLTTAPASCADGATYIVATAGGAWSTGAAKDLATAVGINAANGWLFKTPVEGCFAYAQDENALYYYSGSAWTAYTAGAAGGLLAANNLSDVANAGTSRTNLGLAIGTNVQAYSANLTTVAAVTPTTVGTNLLGVTNPSAITFLRVNADNSVSLLSASAFRTAIGAGTGGGDASGPASSVDGHVALFDSTTGKLLKDSGVAILANGGTIVPTATPATTEIGYLGAPQNLGLDSGAVSLALTDCGKHLYHTDANARTLTIPANSSVAFPIGTVIAIVNENGAAAVSIAITSDTLRWGSSTGTRSLAANGTASLLKVASTVWRLTGDGIT